MSRTRLSGRAWAKGRQPLRETRLEVWRQIRQDGAAWQPIGSVTTSRRGVFRYRASKGPARLLRFRYPGTSQIRPSQSDVDLRVKAATTIEPNKRRVINGEDVIFRGRLLGGRRPAAGPLVELQVRARGKWRTFAQPRARQKSGRWVYRYRFETIRGKASFRFRARIREQPNYPYATGASRAVRVRVIGLR